MKILRVLRQQRVHLIFITRRVFDGLREVTSKCSRAVTPAPPKRLQSCDTTLKPKPYLEDRGTWQCTYKPNHGTYDLTY